MRVYIARQPIFDENRSLFGYELLYRESQVNQYSKGMDGSRATKAVISDALTTFGMKNLTNGKYAFINFTRELFLGDFPLLLNPKDFVVEILEDTEIDEALIEQADRLREQGYILALDDYTGDPKMDEISEHVDIIKVDFLQTSRLERTKIARRFFGKKRLLAEKIETHEEFERAKTEGYTLFQGYYFARPTVLSKASVNIASATYVRLMREISKPTPNFEELAEIIRMDINMTYKLLHRINTLEYYRSHRVKSIKHALVRMGINEIKRWALLVLMRDAMGQECDEIIRTALVRGVFAERLAYEAGLLRDMEEAFTTGMFSMIDNIVDGGLPEVLDELYMPQKVKDALLGNEQNNLSNLLHFVCLYENGKWDEAFPYLDEYDLRKNKVSDYYLDAVGYADLAFDDTAAANYKDTRLPDIR